jgi:adenylate cyclase
MLCRDCGFEAAAEFAFCPKCGRKLEAGCPSCGFACPPEFAFCPKCGANLAAPAGESRLASQSSTQRRADDEILRSTSALEGERRQVTVLFADLKGSMELLSNRDPEEARALLDPVLERMMEAVRRYGGTVNQVMGDGIMALFGAPLAQEDHASRACHAALRMQELVTRYAEDARRAHGVHVKIRVGLNSGEVVVRSIGSDLDMDYTAVGETTHLAARMEQMAAPGSALVCEPTYRLARHAVALEPLGEVTVKGRLEPVAAYRLVGPLAQPRSPRGLEAFGLAAPLVGRDDELAQLLAAFDRMLHGRTQVVSLIGEAGAGKSRLLREFLDRLEAKGRLEGERVSVRRAVCSPLGEQAYGALAALFRDAYSVARDDPAEVARQKLASGLAALGADEEEIAQIGPLVGHVLGIGSDDPRLRYVEPEQLKRQLFLAVRNILERRLRQGPLVLVIEDLHWTDAASVDLLRFLVDRLADRQFMLLLAHRPTFEGGALVSGRAAYTAIRLSPFSLDESRALLQAFFGPSFNCLPADARELIISRAGGNPFYLEEVVRSLIEAGVLVRQPDGWACQGDVEALDVPPTLQGLLQARLDRLPPASRRLLQEAAVIGPVFSERLLLAVCSEPGAADLHLDTLYDAELIGEMPHSPAASGPAERRYSFTHALLQDVAYRGLLVRRRTELHGRVAEALEVTCGAQPERLEELEALGHHFSMSAEKPRGARYLMSAGDWARAIYANEDAARYYRRALDTLAACDASACGDERLTACERLADVLGPMGRREEALQRYRSVLEADEEVGDRPAQARLRRKIGTLHWEAGDRERALAHYRAGLALLDGQTEHIELAHLHQEMGRLAFRTGDNQQAIDWAQRALVLAERLAARAPECRLEAAAAIAQAHNTLGIALARSGGLEEAVEHIERSLAVAQEHELLAVVCRAYTNLGVLYSTLAPGRAIETCLAGLELARKIGDLGLQPWLYANLAGAYCTFTGQCEDEGIAAAQTAIELDRQLGQLDHLAVPLIVLGQIHQCHGEPELALRYYREALGLGEEMREPQLLFPCYDGLATLHLETGDEAEAERYMLKGQEICERAGLEPDSLIVLPFLG